MTFLEGLHGSIVTILICVLLFIDEAGVPLPFAPNEVLLLFAGVLIASGAVPAFVFYPLAVLAMVLGSFVGYSWARQLGPAQLRGIAEKIRAVKAYDRARARMQQADAWQITLTRLIPGIRTYATLVAGAAEVPLGRFMKGSVPAIFVWALVITALGVLVGVPAEHFLTDVEKLALSGGLFVVLGIFGYRAATKARTDRRDPVPGPFVGIARRDRVWLGFLVDAGVVATIVAGFDRITRFVDFHLNLPFAQQGSGWDVLTIVAGLALCYIILSRRSSTGETAGERLFDISYVHWRRAAELRRVSSPSHHPGPTSSSSATQVRPGGPKQPPAVK